MIVIIYLLSITCNFYEQPTSDIKVDPVIQMPWSQVADVAAKGLVSGLVGCGFEPCPSYSQDMSVKQVCI